MNSERGFLIVFTGNGKGKTTAALGMAMRAAGHGMRTLVLQFIKGSWDYGELKSFENIQEIEITRLGSGFTWQKEGLDEDRRLAEVGWEEAVFEIKRGYYDMIVLDELNVVLSYELLPKEAVLQVLENRPSGPHIVVTGRNAPAELVEIADLVTEMKEMKHPFRNQRMKARKGIEF